MYERVENASFPLHVCQCRTGKKKGGEKIPDFAAYFTIGSITKTLDAAVLGVDRSDPLTVAYPTQT